MDEIFLIEKGWIDPMENHDAAGYNSYKFVLTEEEAKEFCDSQGYWTVKDCWVIDFNKVGNKMPKFRYKKLNKL